MRTDSCRKCGNDLEIKDTCKECEEALEYYCPQCDTTSGKQIHLQCMSVNSYQQIVKVTVNRK